MKRKTVKIIAYVIIICLVLTSFSFVMFLPGSVGAQNNAVYGATEETGTPIYGTTAKNNAYLNSQMIILKDYIEYVYKYYKDDVDYKTLLNGAFEGVIEALDDPYSEYYSTEAAAESFREQVDSSFEGIGVHIREQDGKCYVVAPVNDSPAAKAGIISGDYIVAIDGKSVSGKTISEIAELLKGKIGTSVSVTIERGGKEKVLTLKRAAISNSCIYYAMAEDGIGYMEMTGFDSDASDEFRQAVKQLKNAGATKLIIDLRNNPGGYVDQAVEIADIILASGDISHLETKGTIVESFKADSKEYLDMPIVLLTNNNTASSSEILAAALQENKAAVIVGTTTYGKGEAQQIANISNGSAVKLSMYYFLTPSQKEINHVGVSPDYAVENLSATASEIAEMGLKYTGFAPMSEYVKPTLGTVGLNVYGAQQRLAFLGYNVNINGTMDASTVQAVKAFQTAQGLYAYGVLDYSTMNILDATAAKKSEGVSDTDYQFEKALQIIKTMN